MGTLDRLLDGKQAKLFHILEFKDNFLGAVTAKTTIRISAQWGELWVAY